MAGLKKSDVQRSRLAILGALAGAAATGGCLAVGNEGVGADKSEEERQAEGRRLGVLPNAPAPRRDGEGGGGGGGGGGSH